MLIESNVGVVPKEWKVKSIGELADLITKGTSPSTEGFEFVNKGINYIRAENISQNGSFTGAFKKVSQQCHEKLSRSVIKENDILVSIVGYYLGKTAIVSNREAPANTNQNLAIIRISNKGYCQKYVKQIFESDYLIKYINKNLTVGAQPSLSLKQISDFIIPIPPLPEQKKIAKILSTVDNHIDEVDGMIEDLKELKKGLMQKLLTEGIGHTEFKDSSVGRIPVEWEVKELGSIGKTYNGLTGKTKEDFGEGYPYVQYTNIFKNTKVDITNLDYVKIMKDETQNSVKYGDVLFTTSSETANEAGMSSIFLDEREEVYLTSFCFGYRLNNFKNLNPKFARYLFRGQVFRKMISTIAQGSTRYNLSKNNVMKLQIPLPTVNEQNIIAESIEKVEIRMEIFIQEKVSLIELKKGLMQQLLTGKTRVKIDN